MSIIYKTYKEKRIYPSDFKDYYYVHYLSLLPDSIAKFNIEKYDYLDGGEKSYQWVINKYCNVTNNVDCQIFGGSISSCGDIRFMTIEDAQRAIDYALQYDRT